MGYPIEDTIDRHPVIVEENVKWLKEIAKITKETAAIVGFVEPRKYDHLTGKNIIILLRYYKMVKFKELSENLYSLRIQNSMITGILSHLRLLVINQAIH